MEFDLEAVMRQAVEQVHAAATDATNKTVEDLLRKAFDAGYEVDDGCGCCSSYDDPGEAFTAFLAELREGLRAQSAVQADD